MIIDIFDSGPYINITELLSESINELGIFCIQFFFLLILTLFFKRLSFNRLALLLPIIQIIYVWSVSIKSEFVISFSLAFIITALVKLLELLPLNILDYSFLFSVMLFPSRLFNSTSALLGSLWIFWILFCVIYTTVKIGIHKLKGSHFICYFLFIILSLAMYSFNLSAVFLYPVLARLFESSALGIICTITLITIIIFLITFFVKNKFYYHIIRLNSCFD